MRSKFVAIAAVCGLALAARAEDTKAPSIADVKASAKGGKVTIEARITDETGVLSAICHHRSPGGAVDDSPMVKDDYDDVFKVTFSGGADSEYWLESSDLLGNGPSVYGTQAKPYTANGKPSSGKAVAQAEPKEEKPKHHASRRTGKQARSSGPPVIEHRKPSTQPPENKDFTLRMKIHSESPVAVSLLLMRQQGMSGLNNVKLNHGEGDSYDGTIPAAQAKGTVEYFIVAKNEAGQVTRLGDGDAKTPFTVNFKPGSAAVAAAPANTGPYAFTDNPPYRVPPGKAIVLRAQVVPTADDGTLPDRVVLLWRGNDAQDQMSDMQPDPAGGYGGFRVELPAQPDEGAIF
ncbi:MAG TPA: hypothetical protein VH083_20840, partial [Myxococcales bacterium]|nr:hypothetical protein [Myxococcales bacterium]